jgi:hypothetical protein
MEERMVITPKTKVLQLIDTYPQLEEILIEYAPAFKSLRNPALRRTIGKVATLQQAAAIGNVSVEKLINRLREEVGQDMYTGDGESTYNTIKPQWFKKRIVRKEFDAAEMLNRGDQPVNQIMADLNSLEGGTIYKLKAPFVTAPVIDKATSLGLEHWIRKKGDKEYHIYFYKTDTGS